MKTGHSKGRFASILSLSGCTETGKYARPWLSGLPTLRGGGFLKKLGASFSRDPPPGVGVGHWWVSFVPCPYIFQAPKAPENFFLCIFPDVVLVFGGWVPPEVDLPP